MGREFPTAEDDFELSLELSIGGCYAKSERETTAPSEGEDGGREIPRSDFSCDKPEIEGAPAENGCDFSDLQRRREMQAMKRREARMKREFKKSRGMNGCFVDDRVNFEAQQFHGGAEEREREGIPEEPAPKREKSSNASPLGENKVSYERQQVQAQFLLPVGNGFACPWVVPLWGSNVVAGESDTVDGQPENVAAPSWSGRRSSSAVSHHRSTSLKGGSSSDTGSHSSSFGTHQSDKVKHPELNNLSSQIGTANQQQSTKKVESPSCVQQQHSNTSKSVDGLKIQPHSNLTENTCATVEKPSSSSPRSCVVNTPPKFPDGGASGLQMPCVSTTGNGPNGRTITGFLHKYTKAEVSIMCVCHGSFFTPAGFVEHAGGVDITHPLRHITVVPSVVR